MVLCGYRFSKNSGFRFLRGGGDWKGGNIKIDEHEIRRKCKYRVSHNNGKINTHQKKQNLERTHVEKMECEPVAGMFCLSSGDKNIFRHPAGQ